MLTSGGDCTFGDSVKLSLTAYFISRSGLYLELASLKELVDEYREVKPEDSIQETRQAIFDVAQRCGYVVMVEGRIARIKACSLTTYPELYSQNAE